MPNQMKRDVVQSLSIEIGSSFEKVVPGMKSPFSRFFGSGEKDGDSEAIVKEIIKNKLNKLKSN